MKERRRFCRSIMVDIKVCFVVLRVIREQNSLTTSISNRRNGRTVKGDVSAVANNQNWQVLRFFYKKYWKMKANWKINWKNDFWLKCAKVTVTEAVKMRTPIRHWIQPHIQIEMENQGGSDNNGSTSIARDELIIW